MSYTSGIFDTHAHLCDEAYDEDRNLLIREMLGYDSGNPLIKGFVECSTSKKDLLKTKNLAHEFDEIYFAAGIHPHSALEYDNEAEKIIEELLEDEKCVAVGEIGLDYYYDFSPRDLQKKTFEKQLCLASEKQLPVIIHSRESSADLIDILSNKGKVKGVLHCFSENADYMKEILDIGLFIGFGGAVTFKKRENIQEAAKLCPIERLLIETDSPYMTPVPLRGKRNRPDNTLLTALKIAELKGVNVEEVIFCANKNAEQLFGIVIDGNKTHN